MLDINFIRENTEQVKKTVADKKVKFNVDELLKTDNLRRDALSKVEALRREKNEAAHKRDIEKGKSIKEQLNKLEKSLEICQEAYKKLMYEVPNVPLSDVPDGDESNNKLLRKNKEPSKLTFKPKDHIELGEKLEIIDIQKAAQVSGSRFAYLKGEGALLELALVYYVMEILVKKGFIPVIPPALIKQEVTEKLGYWNGGGNENYYLVHDFEVGGPKQGEPLLLYLIGTGEHALVPLHNEEILEEKELPKKYAAFSSCFRREAGSYGKDTHGILRVHQFDKVEMVEFVKPEDDEKERREMLSIAETIMDSLGLPYRVVQLAKGDLSFPSAETVDIETWIPSQERYRETHSISTTTNFQARRFNIKYKMLQPSSLGLMGVGGGSRMEFVHILNGTAIAIGRAIIAILENYQQEDGTVLIPEVLQKYTGFSRISPKSK
ncbi:serine--tRNA ligase [Candidatus Daviesbacteria bacterium]|nr:serine--tRNA ligase [Candidatus Daviesbacteria bacterium]